MRRPMIYVAGPLSKGVVAQNIRKALETAEGLWECGFVPVVPHLTHFWNCMITHEDTRHKDSFWMAYDFATLDHCDLMYRIEGESTGADMEEQYCKENRISIVHSLYECGRWLSAWHNGKAWYREDWSK